MAAIYNPRQIALVTCRGRAEVLGREQEMHDIVPTSWHSPASSGPPMYIVLLSEKMEFARSLIRQSRVFCVNFIPYALRDSAAYLARHIGMHPDKLGETELTLSECEKIDCPRISEAAGHLECELVEEKTVGDHTMFIGKVAVSVLSDSGAKRLFQADVHNFTTTTD